MDFLISADKALLLFFNGHHARFFDLFFYLFSGKIVWAPVAVIFIFLLFKNQNKRAALVALLFLLAAIVLSDQISSFIKHAVERPRPTRDEDLSPLVQTVFGYRGGRFGFVSSHAANSFAFAVFASLIFRAKGFALAVFAWALANSFSRVYLGVHYPLDVFCGAILGVAISLFCYFLFFKTVEKWNLKLALEKEKARVLTVSLAVSVLFLALISLELQKVLI